MWVAANIRAPSALFSMASNRRRRCTEVILNLCKVVDGLDHVRSEIEHMRAQVGRQEILQLQRTGISTSSAELLLTRMLAKIEGLCAERTG